MYVFALSKNVNSPLCLCDADSMSGKLLQCMFAERVMITLADLPCVTELSFAYPENED